jgi:phosphoadenosine phosphosulfate reductase
VRSIEAWPGDGGDRPRRADAGQSVGITLDRELFIARGDVIAHAEHQAPHGRRLKARMFWLHDTPLAAGASVSVRLGSAETRGAIAKIGNVIDPGDQSAANRAAASGRPSEPVIAPAQRVRPLAGPMASSGGTGWTGYSGQSHLKQNHIGDVEIALANPVAADPYEANPRTGRIVLDVGGAIAGGGLVLALDDESQTIAVAAEKSPALAARAASLDRALAGLSLAERLAAIREGLDGAIVFTTSFGLEDQVILHHICDAGLDIDVVTLDTGRLFPETYTVWEETERRYGRRIRAVFPHRAALEDLISAQGINGFYHAKQARIACCDVRKVEPLKRALAGAQGWITGLRAEQSADRAKAGVVIADRERNLLKFNPLIDWSRHALEECAFAHEVPVNTLHQRGFLSIGCAPCTRAVRPGEPERAGRWWWEDGAKKECGLHVAADAAR